MPAVMAARGNETWNVQETDAKRALAEDTYDDCTSCRVTGIDLSQGDLFDARVLMQVIGSVAFAGLGVYSYYTGMNNLRKQEQAIMSGATKYKMGSRKLGIATISATLVGMAIWRALN